MINFREQFPNMTPEENDARYATSVAEISCSIEEALDDENDAIMNILES